MNDENMKVIFEHVAVINIVWSARGARGQPVRRSAPLRTSCGGQLDRWSPGSWTCSATKTRELATRTSRTNRGHSERRVGCSRGQSAAKPRKCLETNEACILLRGI